MDRRATPFRNIRTRTASDIRIRRTRSRVRRTN